MARVLKNVTIFFLYISKETIKANNEGAGFVLQMDGNLWAGENIIKDDPNKQNMNGKRFESFLNQNPHHKNVD